MKFAIIGTGAIGGFYGGMLAKANNEVHFLLHSDYEYVKEHGLTIQSDIHGTFTVQNGFFYNNPDQMPICDVIFICLKTTQNEKELPKILPFVSNQESIIILIQNGLGVEADVSHAFPSLQIAGCMAFIGSNKIGPGKIHHLEHGTLRIGSFNVKQKEKLDSIANHLKAAKIDTILSDNLPLIRWQKLIWNMGFNGTCVILNNTTDKLLENKHTRQLIKDLMTETICGAKACGVDLKEEMATQTLLYTDAMKPYKPSMYLDFERKNEMELKYIYQRPIEYAENAGFEMKKMKVILQELQFIQAQYL